MLSFIFELSSQTPAALSDSTPSAARENHQGLKLNQRIDRQIISGQTHYYQVRSRVGHFFSVEIEHWGMDLLGTFSSPSDHQQTDFVCSTDDITVASVISATDEEYTLALRAGGDNSTVSRYQIRLRELRPAVATDKDRVRLEKVLADADRLRRERKKESYKQALEKYQEARQRARTLSDRVNEAKSLKNLGKTFEALNQNDEAVTQYLQALAVSKTTGDLRLQADITNCLGYCYSSIGSNRDALKRGNDALRLSRMADSRSLEGQALFVLGEAHYGLGNVSRALDHYQRALTIKRALDDYQGQVPVLVNLGYAYSSLSDTVKAREACLEARALSVRAQNPFWEAKSLRALGIISTRLGEYQNALNYFLQALRIFDVIDDRLTQATVLAGIGFTYENLGEEKKALDYDNEAISIFQEVKNPWGEAELQMDAGRVHYTMGETAQALERYQRALLLLRSLGITRLQAQTLRDMGLVYESSGDLTQALDFYNQSLALGRTGQDQRAVAYTLDYVGHIHERRGDRTRALSFYQQALRLNRLAADPGGEALTLFHIARAHRDLGNLPHALSQIEAGLKLSESLRTNVSNRDVRASFVASTHRYYELHADILMQLHRLRPEERFAEDALEATEKGRARSLVESLQEAHADIRQGVDPTLLQREISLLQALNTKAARRAQLTSPKDKHAAEAVEKEIDRLTIEHGEVWSQIKSNSPRYAALTQPQPLSLKEIQQQVLDDDTVLLEYLLGDKRSYLWAVTRTEVSSYELAGRAQIEEAVRQFRKSLTVNQPISGETVEQRKTRIAEANARLPAEAAALSKLIIGPAIGKLGTKRLLIVPDGALQFIPFQALTIPAPTGASGSDEQVPLIVDHEIVYEPSASTLALVRTESARRRTAPKSVAVFAHPVFEPEDPRVKSSGVVMPETMDSSATSKIKEAFRDIGFGDKIPALPASREEADAIIAVAPWGTGWKALGFDASRATVTSPELARYRIVHFATHGLVDYQHPELSGLVLSLVDQDGKPQDGFLRLHDIYNLKLSANLVVLSACNTGLGKEVRGEGLMGMTRGFMYAGATAVAASLWKVDDEATAELMKGFYEGMFRKGLTPAAALRESQLAMWRQKRWHAPYFWAAFTIQGQYDQIEEIASPKVSRSEWLVSSAGVLSGLFLASCLVLGRRRSRNL